MLSASGAASFLSSAAAPPPSVASPSAASPSAGASGSFTTVGAATDATVKSLSLIVGEIPSPKFAAEILIVSPISKPYRSKTISSGILLAGQLS